MNSENFAPHPPAKFLLRTLVATALCVGIIVQPLYVTYLMSEVRERRDICRYISKVTLIAGYVLDSVSLFTLTALNMNRQTVAGALIQTSRNVEANTSLSFVVFIVGSTTLFWNYPVAIWYEKIYIYRSVLSQLNFLLLAHANYSFT